MFGSAASNNEAVRVELRQPRNLNMRIKQAGFANDAYIAGEGAVAHMPDRLRWFLNGILANNIVHAIWDSPGSKGGIGTRLLRGEALVYDGMMGRAVGAVMTELTVRVPDEEAARWIQKICGGPMCAWESNANPGPEGTPYLAICVDRPQPDGTTIRETIRVDVQA